MPPGADLIVPLANGEPRLLLDTLEENAHRLERVRVHQMHALRNRAYIRGEFGSRLRHVSYFLSDATRDAYRNGTCDLVPNHFSEVPALLRRTRCSAVLAVAAPPDAHGYFSLGTSADYVASLIGHTPFFLEVNSAMPRTFGQNQVHVSQIAGYVEHHAPLTEVAPAAATAPDRRIAAFVAERVPDGATIQARIGALPGAVFEALSGHRDLGMHTELFSDAAMALVEAGVITGTCKTQRPGKIVTTFALGTARLYAFIHENAAIEMLPVDWVNDPRVIGSENRFVSVNATTEVDLYGQCASETVAGHYWSSSGGQADFARGAMYSEGGQGFIVLRSTTADGAISRISARLTPGSVVTTLKNTVDHVVTEYGVAELRGRTVAERARALIAVAHPDFREELEREAHAMELLGRR